MNNVVIQKEAIKRVINSKLTWFMTIVWVVFIVLFIIADIDHLPYFSHWLSKGLLYLFALLFGIGAIFFFKYNTRLYIGKIHSQNQLLQQRESMLRKSNEKLLRQSKFLKLVTDSFSHPFIVVDANTYEILIANKAFLEHHLLSDSFELNRNKCYELSHQFQHPCEGTNHPCPLQKAKQSGKPVVTQHKHVNTQGEEKIMEITAFPVLDEESGKVKQIIEYNVDITERLREQVILSEKEARLRTIISTSPDGITVVDMEGIITFASGKSAALLGYNQPDELVGKNVFEFLHPDERQKGKEAATNLLLNKTQFETIEFKSLKLDGTLIFLETNASLLFDKNDRPTAMVLVTRDITERKNTQEHLLNLNSQLQEQRFALQELNKSLEQRIKDEVEISREKDRMLALQSRQAAMGEMIGNIAHQWRQPLNAINLIIFDMLEAQNHGELNEKYLQSSYNEVNRVVQTMSQTIDDFRNFFKPGKELKTFDINKVVEQAVMFTGAGIAANNIKIVTNITGEIAIEGYPNELMQTLINILENARDALLVSEAHPRTISIATTLNQDTAIIDISNNGDAIPPDHIDRIFDPYYSTKPEGQGTGMGLFISKTIIEKNMHGRLTVSNLPDGPCFSIELQTQRKKDSIVI